MTEALQEQLLRGPVIIPEVQTSGVAKQLILPEMGPKPWSNEKREKYVNEYHTLGQAEAFLGAQLRDIQERRAELRRLIAESYNMDGYGKTDTPLDLESKPLPKTQGIIRGFSKLLKR